jgi:hypothetical protein
MLGHPPSPPVPPKQQPTGIDRLARPPVNHVASRQEVPSVPPLPPSPPPPSPPVGSIAETGAIVGEMPIVGEMSINAQPPSPPPAPAAVNSIVGDGTAPGVR